MTDIGAMLREARMREHRDIAEFEARTKIRAKYLRALEDEEWTLLPGYTFAKAFLRTYADMLGLDGRMLVDEFKRQYQDPSEAELAPVMPARGEARRSRERAPERGRERGRGRRERPAGPSSLVLAVALLVVLVAAALLVVHELRGKGHTTPPTGSTSKTTSTSHSHTHAATPLRVSVALVATTPVRVCLIGYRSANGGAHRRYDNTLLSPGSRAPVLHADDHFLASFTGGSLRLIVNGHAHTVTATGTTVAYEIFRSGRYSRLATGAGPHCP
jgi:cytoskeleton protein RodZ